MILLLFVIIPVSYFVLVPSYIQYRLDTVGSEKLHLEYLKINDFTGQMVNFQIKASLPPFFFLPIKVGFGPCQFTVYDSQRDVLGHLSIPFIEFWLNDDFNLDFSGNVSMVSSNITAIDSIMKSFSSDDGLRNFFIDAHSYVPLTAAGIHLYSGLSLHKKLEVGDVKSDLKALLNSVPPLIKTQSNL